MKMSGDTKLLTGLLERRALTSTFAELATLTDAEKVAACADQIASHGQAALSVLLSLLDTEDAQLRGHLGQVIKRLDRESAITALRGVAHGPRYTDQARITALTLLERFLAVPVDDSLLAGLQNPNGVAQQSLRELIYAMGREPASILEYLSQLAEQPPEVAQMILDAVPQMPASPHLVDLLRMLAQGEQRPLAQDAITLLSRTRSPDARAALQVLTAVLPSELAALADRGARKLMMSGVRELNAEAEGVTRRVLLSPVNSTGAQLIWFVRQTAGQEKGALLAVVCSDLEGIVDSSALMDASTEALPPIQPIGSIYEHQPASGWGAVSLLEIPFALGREIIQQALARHWAAGTLPPVEFRWLNPLIFDFTAPDAEVTRPTPSIHTPAEIAALLDHPAFSAWGWQSEAVFKASRTLGQRPSAADRAEQISALATEDFEPQMTASYQRRLAAMAQWLALAGLAETAALAASASAYLAHIPPTQSLFIRRLIGAGLDAAAVQLRWRTDLR